MAGRRAAAGSDHGDSLVQPSGDAKHTVGAVHLRGKLPNRPAPPQDVLAYTEQEEGVRSNIHTRERNALFRVRLHILVGVRGGCSSMGTIFVVGVV